MTTSLHEPAPCPEQMPITLRALIQRINRVLAKDQAVLKKVRGRYARGQCGDYYVLHWRSQRIRCWHVDPVALAQELGVLEAWEAVREED